MDKDYKYAIDLCDQVAVQLGRRPRIMIANIFKKDQVHKRNILASSFADLGFDVDIAPYSLDPKLVVRQAAENDVHLLGISLKNMDQFQFCTQILDELKKIGRDDILVIIIGNITSGLSSIIFEKGVSAILNPSDDIVETAIELLKVILD